MDVMKCICRHKGWLNQTDLLISMQLVVCFRPSGDRANTKNEQSWRHKQVLCSEIWGIPAQRGQCLLLFLKRLQSLPGNEPRKWLCLTQLPISSAGWVCIKRRHLFCEAHWPQLPLVGGDRLRNKAVDREKESRELVQSTPTANGSRAF